MNGRLRIAAAELSLQRDKQPESLRLRFQGARCVEEIYCLLRPSVDAPLFTGLLPNKIQDREDIDRRFLRR